METFKDFVKKSKVRGEEGYFADDSFFSAIFISPLTLSFAYAVKKFNIKITPNQISCFRLLFLSPLMLFILFLAPILNQKIFFLYGAGIFYFILFTDFLDGQIARGINMKSNLGSFLDSIGDRTGTLLFFVLLISTGLFLKNNFLLYSSILLFFIKSTSLMILNMIFFYKGELKIKKKIPFEYSGKRDKEKLGIEKVLSLINKSLEKISKGAKISQFERYVITIIIPCLLLFLGYYFLAEIILTIFLVIFLIFYISRTKSLLGYSKSIFS